MMDSISAMIGFTLAAAVLTVTPGLDTLLVLRTAASEGARRALAAGLGIVAGCLVWGMATAMGLGVVLATSRLLYDALRIAGAAYLLYLGIGLLRGPRRAWQDDSASPAPQARRSWFVRGLTTNLLNPKVGIFYASFMPQFVPSGVEVTRFTMLLAAIHAALGMAWFGVLVAMTRPIAAILRRPLVIAWLDRVTGGVLIAFGMKVALETLRRRIA